MVEAIRVIAQYLAAQVGKATLDARVLRAMAKVPRHEFVPVEVKPYAYLNRPLPIGFDKTISQPLIVAVMTDMLELQADDVVLEIGTGLGYRHTELDRSRLANRQCPSSVPPGSCRRQFLKKSCVIGLCARSSTASSTLCEQAARGACCRTTCRHGTIYRWFAAWRDDGRFERITTRWLWQIANGSGATPAPRPRSLTARASRPPRPRATRLRCWKQGT
jgi:hypothetical protein